LREVDFGGVSLGFLARLATSIVVLYGTHLWP